METTITAEEKKKANLAAMQLNDALDEIYEQKKADFEFIKDRFLKTNSAFQALSDYFSGENLKFPEIPEKIEAKKIVIEGLNRHFQKFLDVPKDEGNENSENREEKQDSGERKHIYSFATSSGRRFEKTETWNSVMGEDLGPEKKKNQNTEKLKNSILAELRSMQKNAEQPIKTGFQALDSGLSGGFRSGLHILAAASGVGKTTLALNIACNMAEDGQNVFFYSLEQTKAELTAKLISRELFRLAPESAPNGSARAWLENRLDSGLSEMAISSYAEKTGGRLRIFDRGHGISFDQISSDMAECSKKPVLIIDYLQIFPAPVQKMADQRAAIDAVLSRLIDIKTRGACIIAISSLSRSNYLQPFSMESLKESGMAEYSADTVLGLQPSIMDSDLFLRGSAEIAQKRDLLEKALMADQRALNLKCVKNRAGALFSVPFMFRPANDFFFQPSVLQGGAANTNRSSIPRPSWQRAR